ncbi:MAG TPA: FG-GAP-like repeat-containing protein, partial [Mucilaginibacter sp.]|nr:FG-GAP-like repeat-containing protein [Mucilaginibacter sp.]
MKRFLSTILLSGLTALAFAQENPGVGNNRGLSFPPDYSFKGSNLTDWHPMGNGSWQAHDGEISVNANGSSTLLASGRSFQDVLVHTLIKAAPGSEAGILIRLQKTTDGYKAILMAVKDNEAANYKVTFDAQGKELTRERLRNAGQLIRVAPKPPADAPAGSNGNARRGNGGNRRSSGPADLPMKAPSPAIVPGDWNQFEIAVDFNIIRKFVNDTFDPQGGATDDNANNGGQGYGPIALYASGSGMVQFKDLKYKDAHIMYTPKEASASRFKPQRISDMSYSFSATAADYNRDGYMDVVAGPYIYWGPDYTHYQEIYFAQSYNPSTQFPSTNCQYSFDLNNDGWPDMIIGAPGMMVYMNPKGESRRWDGYKIVPGGVAEVTTFRDIDGDGRPELVYSANGGVYYAKYDPADPTKTWAEHRVSGTGYYVAHGIGVGDINGDGKMDILNPYGWWEQPATGTTDTAQWKFHPQSFGRYGHYNFSGGLGGSVMGVYDVNGDGLNDVVTSLNAHGFGLAWFEQKRDKAGNISFVEHMIMDDFSSKNAGDVTFSELHGTNFADINGDGIPDFIAGKRYWSHLDSYFDPYAYGPAVVYA